MDRLKFNRFVLTTFFLLTSFLYSSIFNLIYAQSIDEEIIKQYAPLVYIHPDDEFKPSSVDYFLNNINVTSSNLITKYKINCPSCTNLSFFKGQSVTQDNIPIYAMVVPKPNIGENITDVFYWMFYPYNRGKRVCISPIYINGNCWGKYSTFGHHVGDWEHVTIRFKDNQPIQIYLSQHAGGKSYTWADNNLEYVSSSPNTGSHHPVVYSAKGSHGLYNSVDEHVYQKIFNGDHLTDLTGKGDSWQTWKNIKMIKNENLSFKWQNYSGRWGNPKDGCDFLGFDFEGIIGACIFNAGPYGPNMKSYTQSHQSCIEDEFIEHLSDQDKQRFCNS